MSEGFSARSAISEGRSRESQSNRYEMPGFGNDPGREAGYLR